MNWCCLGFSAHVQAAGQRGFAIVVDDSDPSGAVFVIQHRAIDIELDFPFVWDKPISIVTDVQMQYCPWCGVLLSAFYAEGAAEISRPELRVQV